MRDNCNLSWCELLCDLVRGTQMSVTSALPTSVFDSRAFDIRRVLRTFRVLVLKRS